MAPKAKNIYSPAFYGKGLQTRDLEHPEPLSVPSCCPQLRPQRLMLNFGFTLPLFFSLIVQSNMYEEIMYYWILLVFESWKINVFSNVLQLASCSQSWSYEFCWATAEACGLAFWAAGLISHCVTTSTLQHYFHTAMLIAPLFTTAKDGSNQASIIW